MKIAVLSRPGPCFPNVISMGLTGMLNELGVENKIFYEGLPMLMRLLPLHKKPKRWHNNLQYRLRNKLSHYFKDRKLIKELNQYDAVILSECYPNAFWKNYFAIEELKQVFKGPVISYTESPLDAAPFNKKKLLDDDDYNETIYDYNLFVTDVMEQKVALTPRQALIGTNIAINEKLLTAQKKEFTAVVDFAQPGYELYRQQQVDTLNKMGIRTIVLEGRYPIEEIRKIYAQAAVFFLSFPETFGLPIAECLACGTYVFSPSSAWPMAWRLNDQPVPMEEGTLPDCFRVYKDAADLEIQLQHLMAAYDPQATPRKVVAAFLKNYSRFYYGDKNELEALLYKLHG